MNGIRILDLLEMGRSQQRIELLGHRPEPSDSRMQWWLGIVDQIVAEWAHAQAAGIRDAYLELALHTVELAHSEGDLSDTDAVVVLADLGNRASTNDGPLLEILPEQIIRRALSAISLDRTRVSDVIARERRYLLEDERAWDPSAVGDPVADIEFGQLDDLRRILAVLEQSVQYVDDESLRREALEWLAFKDSIHHGPEIGARGRELLLKKKKNDAPGAAPEDPFYSGPVA